MGYIFQHDHSILIWDGFFQLPWISWSGWCCWPVFFKVLFQQITNSILSASVHCTDLTRNFSKSTAILDFPCKVMGKLGGAAKRRTGWQAWVKVCSFTRYPTSCEFSGDSKIVYPKAPKKQNQSFFWHSTFFTTSVIFQVSTAPGSMCYETAPYCWWKKSG